MLDQMNLFGFNDEPPGASGPAAKMPRGARKRHELFFAICPMHKRAKQLPS